MLYRGLRVHLSCVPWLELSYVLPLGVSKNLTASIVAAISGIVITLEQLHCGKN